MVALVSTGRRVVVPHRPPPPRIFTYSKTTTRNYKVLPLDWISRDF